MISGSALPDLRRGGGVEHRPAGRVEGDAVDEVEPPVQAEDDLPVAAVPVEEHQAAAGLLPGSAAAADGDVAVVVVGAEPDDLQPAVGGAVGRGEFGVGHDGAGLVDAEEVDLAGVGGDGQEVVAVAAPGQREEAGLAVALEAPQVADDERLARLVAVGAGEGQLGPAGAGERLILGTGLAGAGHRLLLAAGQRDRGQVGGAGAVAPGEPHRAAVGADGRVGGAATGPVVREVALDAAVSDPDHHDPAVGLGHEPGRHVAGGLAVALTRSPLLVALAVGRSGRPAGRHDRSGQGEDATANDATRRGARPRRPPSTPRTLLPNCTPANLPLPRSRCGGPGGTLLRCFPFSRVAHASTATTTSTAPGGTPSGTVPATSWYRRRPRRGPPGCSGS